MQPVFQSFNIPVKIYKCVARPVYEFIPGMIKNNHLYPSTPNWDRLNQLKSSNAIELKTSTNFYINDTDKPPKWPMKKNTI